MKNKIEYIDTDSRIAVENELSRIFDMACEVRDKAQEVVSSIIHLKASYGATLLKRHQGEDK